MWLCPNEYPNLSARRVRTQSVKPLPEPLLELGPEAQTDAPVLPISVNAGEFFCLENYGQYPGEIPIYSDIHFPRRTAAVASLSSRTLTSRLPKIFCNLASRSGNLHQVWPAIWRGVENSLSTAGELAGVVKGSTPTRARVKTGFTTHTESYTPPVWK